MRTIAAAALIAVLVPACRSSDSDSYRSYVSNDVRREAIVAEEPQEPQFVPYTVEVMWWNIRRFGTAGRDTDAMAAIGQTVQGMEVVAVGELNDPAALARLARLLGPNWKYAVSPRLGRASGNREHCGFLWDTQTVEMVSPLTVDRDPGDRFTREPVWATFRTVDGRFDFTVLAVHLHLSESGVVEATEIQALPEVWERTQEATAGDDDLILVGDFQRNTTDDAFKDLLAKPGIIRATDERGWTNIREKTTHDQIFIDRTQTREWSGASGTRKFDETRFGDDDASAARKVSDHRPVWVSLVVSAKDDD